MVVIAMMPSKAVKQLQEYNKGRHRNGWVRVFADLFEDSCQKNDVTDTSLPVVSNEPLLFC